MFVAMLEKLALFWVAPCSALASSPGAGPSWTPSISAIVASIA